MRLHISGLDQSTTADDVSTLFKSFRDQVAAIDMIYSKHDGKCSGFCYVEIRGDSGDDNSMPKAADTYAKLKSLYQNTVFRGGKLKISEAKAKRKRQTEETEDEPRDVDKGAAPSNPPPPAQLELITKKNFKQYPSWQKLNNGKLVRKMYVRLAPNSGISSINSNNSSSVGPVNVTRGRIHCIDPKTHFPKDKYIKFREYDVEAEASKQKSILNALFGEEGGEQEEGKREQEDADEERDLETEEELTEEEDLLEKQEDLDQHEDNIEPQLNDEDSNQECSESEEEDSASEQSAPELSHEELPITTEDEKGEEVMKLSTDIKDLFFGSESNSTFKLGLLPEDEVSDKGSMDQEIEKHEEDLSLSLMNLQAQPESKWPFLFHAANLPESATATLSSESKPNQDFLSQFANKNIEIPFTLLKDDYKKRSSKYKRRNNKK